MLMNKRSVKWLRNLVCVASMLAGAALAEVVDDLERAAPEPWLDRVALPSLGSAAHAEAAMNDSASPLLPQ